MAAERTFIMIKPEGVQRGIALDVLSRFEQKGLKLLAIKIVKAPVEKMEKHYQHLKDLSFFRVLCEEMCSGPVIQAVFAGDNAIRHARNIIGATNPLESAPGSIRGDLAVAVNKNVVHGSSSAEDAQAEIALWFGDTPLCEYSRVIDAFF